MLNDRIPMSKDGYEKLKASGAPRQALKDELERVLQLYRDKNIDVSEVRQELLRLSTP